MTEHRHAQRARMVGHLQLFNDVLAASPLAGRAWVWGGLLIGWARERNVLLHDALDADFAVLEEDVDRLEATIPLLVEHGFEPLARYPGRYAPTTEWTFSRGDARVEFFRFDRVADHFRFHVYCGHGGQEPALDLVHQVPAQPLEAFQFLGRTWLKARDHDLELRTLYGDWRTPDPDWNYRHNRAIVDRRPWDMGSYSLR